MAGDGGGEERSDEPRQSPDAEDRQQAQPRFCSVKNVSFFSKMRGFDRDRLDFA
jgi:hypothetical protein